MALVYIGTSKFAADLLAALIERALRPTLVISRPDARQGRGRTLAPPPTADRASELGIELLQPDDVNDAATASAIADAAGDDGPVVLCAFGALITAPLLDARPILNVHPSLLPRWRGAAPIERAIQAGDAETGVSIMKLVRELDAGPVYAQETIEIADGEDYGSLSDKLVSVAADLLAGVISDRPEPVPQPDSGVTYAEKIGAADRTIDLSGDPGTAVRTVRALRPHIGARVELADGNYLGVDDARLGQSGNLELVTVRPAGGRSMAYEDYARGRSVHPQ